jgi:hypothetical protein
MSEKKIPEKDPDPEDIGKKLDRFIEREAQRPAPPGPPLPRSVPRPVARPVPRPQGTTPKAAPRPTPGSAPRPAGASPAPPRPGYPMPPMPGRVNPLMEEIIKKKVLKGLGINDLIEKYRNRLGELDGTRVRFGGSFKETLIRTKNTEVERRRILGIIKELERLRDIEHNKLPVKPRYEKKTALKSAAVCSLFALALGIAGTYYWLRGGSGEEPVRPETPAAETVPKSEYENLHRELSSQIARLRTEKEKLYTQEQVDAVKREVGKLTEILEEYQALGPADDFRAAQQRVSELEEALEEKEAEGKKLYTQEQVDAEVAKSREGSQVQLAAVRKEVDKLKKKRDELAAKVARYTVLGNVDDLKAAKEGSAALTSRIDAARAEVNNLTKKLGMYEAFGTVEEFKSAKQRVLELEQESKNWKSLLDESLETTKESVEFGRKLKYDKTVLRGRLLLEMLKRFEEVYQEHLAYKPGDKKIQENLKVAQKRISELEPLLKREEPSSQNQQELQSLIDKISSQYGGKGREQEQAENKKLEGHIQNLYANIGDHVEFNYLLGSICSDLGESYERQGNLRYARLSYANAVDYFSCASSLNKNYARARKGLEIAVQKTTNLKEVDIKYDHDAFRSIFRNLNLARIMENGGYLETAKKRYQAVKSSYESVLTEHKDFLPAKVSLEVVNKKISELEAKIQKQQGGKE